VPGIIEPGIIQPGIIQPLSGVWLIRLPLPFELNHVNVGIVRLANGYMLVDTGMDTDESFAALSEALGSLGIAWTDIRQVLITHMHPDHIGLLPRVLGLTRATVIMHRDEVDHLNTLIDPSHPPWIDDGLRIAGTPDSMVGAIHHSLKHLSAALRPVRADVPLAGGEEIATALGPAQIVWTPGHTVGHICLYWPSHRAIYAGDLLIEKITPNISWLPGRDCLAEYLNSLHSLLPYEIDTIIPSHGTPFTGHREWIARTEAHHEQRCEQLMSAIRNKPETADHLVPVLWDRHLSPFHYHFALFEVLAHLEYLFRRDRIISEPAGNGSVLWYVSSGVRHSMA